MNIEKENLTRVKELIEELEKLEKAINITKNYDASITASFSSFHNFNTKTPIGISVPISNDIKDAIINNIHLRIKEIKKELEKV